MSWARPHAALVHAQQAIAYAGRHEEHIFVPYAVAIVAGRLRAGE